MTPHERAASLSLSLGDEGSTQYWTSRIAEEIRAACAEARKEGLRDAAEMVVRDAEVIFQGDRYDLRDAILALEACAATPNASTNVE